jgi:hypothetical protein
MHITIHPSIFNLSDWQNQVRQLEASTDCTAVAEYPAEYALLVPNEKKLVHIQPEQEARA